MHSLRFNYFSLISYGGTKKQAAHRTLADLLRNKNETLPSNIAVSSSGYPRSQNQINLSVLYRAIWTLYLSINHKMHGPPLFGKIVFKKAIILVSMGDHSSVKSSGRITGAPLTNEDRC